MEISRVESYKLERRYTYEIDDNEIMMKYQNPHRFKQQLEDEDEDTLEWVQQQIDDGPIEEVFEETEPMKYNDEWEADE
jgi:hypothetical protein